MSGRFLQIHSLTSYPAALLNRDDAGFAKRIPFGGATRTRVSSQCLKRHWRTHQGEHALANLGDLAVRSRLTFEQFVVKPLVAEGLDDKLVRAATEAMMAKVLGKSAKAKAQKGDDQKGDDGGPTIQTGQITVLGRPEIQFLREQVRLACAEQKDPAKVGDAVDRMMKGEGRKNLEALRKAASGLDGAMFGRMVTSDLLARGDAALHVAHAFTVHEELAESDYFSAVDDLLAADDELGSGHIGNAELTSGLFYGYVVVDVPLLVSNLEGCDRKKWKEADRTLAARIVESMIHLIATVSPGAKLGSTAPHAYAHLVLVEQGDSQPRTLANAFLRPVGTRPDLLANTYEALAGHLSELDAMYGRTVERRCAAIGPVSKLGELAGGGSLADLGKWAAEQVRGA